MLLSTDGFGLAEGMGTEPIDGDAAWLRLLPGLRVIRRGAAPIRAFQIYGQRCSGTNVLTRTIRTNLGDRAVTEECGFKHWFVPEQTLFPSDIMVVVIARDPFEWIRSLHRNPWHAHPSLKALDFSRFIRADWHSYWDTEFGGVDIGHPVRGREMLHERCPRTGNRFPNAVAKRTAKLCHWSGLHARAVHLALLDYAALRDTPEAVIGALADIAGLARVQPFAAERSYKGQGFFPFTPARYAAIDPCDQDHIRCWLDPAVESRFGFGDSIGWRNPPSAPAA